MTKENKLRQMADVAFRIKAGIMAKNHIELENHQDELKEVAKVHDELINKIKERESGLESWEWESDEKLVELYKEKEVVDKDLAVLHEIVAQYQLNES